MKKELLLKKLEDFFSTLGLNLSDENYRGTPERFLEFISGYISSQKERESSLNKILSVHFPKHSDLNFHYQGMLIQSDIRVYSICSHHLLPVVYDISFAYIPDKGRQIGFSKIIRALRVLGKRPMNQEDFTQYIVEVFEKKLLAKGVAVQVKGVHFCMSMRGAIADVVNITSAMKGLFLTDSGTRAEFLETINRK